MFTRAFTYLLIYRHIPTTFGHHGFPRMLISSVYIWAPHNNDGDRSIDWRPLQSYSSNCNIVGILSYGFRDSIEKCAQLNCKALYICCEWIYAPRTIILVQYKLWICVNKWSTLWDHLRSKERFFKKCLALQEALKDAFNVFDKDGSGLLDKKTFNDFLRKTGDGGLSDQQVFTHHATKTSLVHCSAFEKPLEFSFFVTHSKAQQVRYSSLPNSFP